MGTDEHRRVGFYRCNSETDVRSHDLGARIQVGKMVAQLLGAEYAGERCARDPLAESESLYWVPSATLSTAEAARLGVRGPSDLFGGVVPHPFIATKVITHPLVRPGAVAPDGWSQDLGGALREVVLPGYSAFSLADAQAAGLAMLKHGAVRLKMPYGIGGSGQTVAKSRDELICQLDLLTPEALHRDGLVLERDLVEVVTYSVGQVTVGPWQAAYVGTQRLTSDRQGTNVYGGSDLRVVRGGFDALRALELPAPEQAAVLRALTYHRLVMAAFDGLFATRCNYDVALGTDCNGHVLGGVLEQSWRIGGASGAELAALLAFAADAGCNVVRASTHEIYADQFEPGDTWGNKPESVVAIRDGFLVEDADGLHHVTFDRETLALSSEDVLSGACHLQHSSVISGDSSRL